MCFAASLLAAGASQAQVLADRVYRLVAAHSGQALNILSAAPQQGAIATQWPWIGTDNSRWKIRSLDGGCVLTAQHTGQALEVADRSPADGARV